MNRCLTEGRRSFLKRYARIESGAECEQWLPTISSVVDGEATPEQVMELRPHLRNCPGCRATLRALQDSADPLAAILPVPLAVATATPDAGDHVSNVLMRIYEMVAGGIHDRAASSLLKAQAVIETSAAGKAAAIAGAAAAVAGGGYATVERTAVERHAERPVERPVKAHRVIRPGGRATQPADAPTVPPARRIVARRIAYGDSRRPRTTPKPRTEFRSISPRHQRSAAPEFNATYQRIGSASTSGTATAAPAAARTESRSAKPAPEFAPAPATNTAPEFGP